MKYAPPYDAYQTACAEGRLLLSECQDCSACQLPMFHICRACTSQNLRSIEASGAGIVASVSEVFRAPAGFFAAAAPYHLCLIDLAEGARMMMRATASVKIGQAVSVVFRSDTPSGAWLPFAHPEAL